MHSFRRDSDITRSGSAGHKDVIPTVPRNVIVTSGSQWIPVEGQLLDDVIVGGPNERMPLAGEEMSIDVMPR